MSSIDKMVEQLSSPEELRIYIASQFKQIERLSKENKDLKSKLDKAEKEAKAVAKSVNNTEIQLSTSPLAIQDDAKTIAQVQLNLLKQASFERELDSDEAKRVELYNRILKDEADASKKTKKVDVEVVSSNDLLKLVE